MRTKEKLDGLVAELTANCGDEFEACRAQAVSPMFLAQWRKDDAEVDAQIVEAIRCGRMRLVSAAVQRAVHGIEKGVYYKGERVDTELQYSDSLLTTLLKTMPEFKEKDGDSKNVFNGPTQINLMPRATTYDEWLAMKDSTNARKALPAPVETIIDAEFTPVIASPQLGGFGL